VGGLGQIANKDMNLGGMGKEASKGAVYQSKLYLLKAERGESWRKTPTTKLGRKGG